MQDIYNNKFQSKHLLFIIFISVILLYFIFSPAVNTLYYAGDSYRYAFGSFSQACKLDDGFEYMLTLGRPIQAYLDCATFKFAYTFEHMRDIRLISIVLLGCAMGLLIEYLVSLGVNAVAAFFIAGIFLLIPEVYIDAVLTGSQPLAYALILGLLAYKFFEKRFLSASLLFLAMLTYPAMAFFFFSLCLAKVLFSPISEWENTKKRVFQEVILFLSVCVIYYIYAYCNMKFFPKAPVTDVAYQVNHPNLNIKEVIARISLLLNVFNKIWSLTPLTNMVLQGWSMIVLLVGGVIIAFIKNRENIQLKQLSGKLFTTICLLLLCSLFILIMPSRVFEPRLLVGAISGGLVLMLWALCQWTLLVPGPFKKHALIMMVTSFFLIMGYQTNITMTVYALSYKQYLTVAKDSIEKHLSAHALKRIHFIISRDSYPYNKFFLANGALMQLLGRNTYNLQWCSLPRGTKGEEKDHQMEMLSCINTLPANTIAITYSYPNERYKESADMLVLNMQDISVASIAKTDFKSYFNLEVEPEVG